MRIKSLTGDKPHPSRGSWSKFLKTCDLRDEHDGVKFYGAVNCNYIVFPCGTLIQNFGYNGATLMSRIRSEGQATVLADLTERRAEMNRILDRVGTSVDKLVDTLETMRTR